MLQPQTNSVLSKRSCGWRCASFLCSLVEHAFDQDNDDQAVRFLPHPGLHSFICLFSSFSRHIPLAHERRSFCFRRCAVCTCPLAISVGFATIGKYEQRSDSAGNDTMRTFAATQLKKISVGCSSTNILRCRAIFCYLRLPGRSVALFAKPCNASRSWR